MSIHNILAPIVKTEALDYTLLSSEVVRNNAGQILIIHNYYPAKKEDIKLSIALSYMDNKWERKCWLSSDVQNSGSSLGPNSRPEYQKFSNQKIQYYPYSINTSDYSLSDLISLCDGLYHFVEKSL